MTYAYVIGTYQEDGLEGAEATLDRSSVHALFETVWPGGGEDDRAALDAVLALGDTALVSDSDGWNILRGWGGPRLYVLLLK